jgi:O-antigen/teichoic acid export membrane protein
MVVGISSALLLFISTFIALRIYDLGIIGALSAYILTHSIIFSSIALEVLLKNSLRISLPLIPRLVRFGIPLVFSMTGGAVLVESSIYFLSYFYDLETVAVYSLGFKLSQLLAITVILPFQLAFQPFVFSNLRNSDIAAQISRMFIYFLLAITFMSSMIILGSHIILPYIAPPEYAQAFSVLLLLLPLAAFLGIHYFSETLLSAVEKTHITGITMTAGAFFCLILNYLLIPSFSWHGAVIASNLSLFTVAITLFLIGIRALSIQIEWHSVSAIAVLFFIFLFMMFMLNSLGQLAFYSGWILMFFTSLALMYLGPFFNKQEKILFRNSAARLRSVISS